MKVGTELFPQKDYFGRDVLIWSPAGSFANTSSAPSYEAQEDLNRARRRFLVHLPRGFSRLREEPPRPNQEKLDRAALGGAYRWLTERFNALFLRTQSQYRNGRIATATCTDRVNMPHRPAGPSVRSSPAGRSMFGSFSNRSPPLTAPEADSRPFPRPRPRTLAKPPVDREERPWTKRPVLPHKSALRRHAIGHQLLGSHSYRSQQYK
jgi:hypothetical protein